MSSSNNNINRARKVVIRKGIKRLAQKDKQFFEAANRATPRIEIIPGFAHKWESEPEMVLIEEEVETETRWDQESEQSEMLAEEEADTETSPHVIQRSAIDFPKPKTEVDKLIMDKLNTLLLMVQQVEDRQATILSRLDNLTEAVIGASGTPRGTPSAKFPIYNVTDFLDFETNLSDATERLRFYQYLKVPPENGMARELSHLVTDDILILFYDRIAKGCTRRKIVDSLFFKALKEKWCSTGVLTDERFDAFIKDQCQKARNRVRHRKWSHLNSTCP